MRYIVRLLCATFVALITAMAAYKLVELMNFPAWLSQPFSSAVAFGFGFATFDLKYWKLER